MNVFHTEFFCLGKIMVSPICPLVYFSSVIYDLRIIHSICILIQICWCSTVQRRVLYYSSSGASMRFFTRFIFPEYCIQFLFKNAFKMRILDCLELNTNFLLGSKILSVFPDGKIKSERELWGLRSFVRSSAQKIRERPIHWKQSDRDGRSSQHTDKLLPPVSIFIGWKKSRENKVGQN